MADLWTPSTAIASLRRRLSDGPDDKYVHQMEVDPEPDGQQMVFAVPDSRLVVDSLVLTLDGATADYDEVDWAAGSFTLAAPDAGQKLRANYYFQWFTDEELTGFINDASQLLGYDSLEDVSLPLALRTPVLSYACYFAYMKKAAEAADSVTASAAGFSTTTDRQNPNWLAMAKLAWENAEKEREVFNTPLGAERPAMAWTSFRMPRYVPRS